MPIAPGTVLRTADEMIEALGGPHAVAELFNLTDYRTPSMWRVRDKIPPAYRAEVARLLVESGYSVPDDFLLPPSLSKA